MINVVKCTKTIYRDQNRIQLNSGCRARFFANTESSIRNQEGFPGHLSWELLPGAPSFGIGVSVISRGNIQTFPGYIVMNLR